VRSGKPARTATEARPGGAPPGRRGRAGGPGRCGWAGPGRGRAGAGPGGALHRQAAAAGGGRAGPGRGRAWGGGGGRRAGAGGRRAGAGGRRAGAGGHGSGRGGSAVGSRRRHSHSHPPRPAAVAALAASGPGRGGPAGQPSQREPESGLMSAGQRSRAAGQRARRSAIPASSGRPTQASSALWQQSPRGQAVCVSQRGASAQPQCTQPPHAAATAQHSIRRQAGQRHMTRPSAQSSHQPSDGLGTYPLPGT
jgi:hypothetical protein